MKKKQTVKRYKIDGRIVRMATRPKFKVGDIVLMKSQDYTVNSFGRELFVIGAIEQIHLQDKCPVMYRIGEYTGQENCIVKP